LYASSDENHLIFEASHIWPVASADPGQLLAAQHVYDSSCAEATLHHHSAFMLIGHNANHCGVG
jgi:hypothetical protein